MQKHNSFQRTNILNQISEFRENRFNELLSILQNTEDLSGILLGGSLSYKQVIENADIDLFCLFHNPNKFIHNMEHFISLMNNVDQVIYQGSFPWTGELYTIYFLDDIDFSIDLCIIDVLSASTFFWEPKGVIIYDNDSIIELSRSSQMDKPDYSWQPTLKSNPFSMSIISLKKIQKNLFRGHLWNALDQVRNQRRYLMQIVRLHVLNNNQFLGRVDRDIEDIISDEYNEMFINTVPIYNKKDIAIKTISLIELSETLLQYAVYTNEQHLVNWISKQLLNEKNKLISYIK